MMILQLKTRYEYCSNILINNFIPLKNLLKLLYPNKILICTNYKNYLKLMFFFLLSVQTYAQ